MNKEFKVGKVGCQEIISGSHPISTVMTPNGTPSDGVCDWSDILFPRNPAHSLSAPLGDCIFMIP
jgi:hypothetical protein